MSHPSLPVPADGQSPFDTIRHADEQGEYWFARELAGKLGYTSRDSWRNFERVIAEAKSVGASQGHDVTTLFVDCDKKSTGGRPGQDYRLTRFACYLVALSAEGTKAEVAAAKIYFAVQTRRQELADGGDAAIGAWRQRAIQSFMAQGYSYEWAERRVDDILARNELTHEWSVRGIKDREYAILTDRLHMGTFGLSISQHKALKGFDVTHRGKALVYKGDLPPAMTATELALNALASTAAREIHIAHDSYGRTAIESDVDQAGEVVAAAREKLEAITGVPVVSPRNLIKQPDGGLWGALPANLPEIG